MTLSGTRESAQPIHRTCSQTSKNHVRKCGRKIAKESGRETRGRERQECVEVRDVCADADLWGLALRCLREEAGLSLSHRLLPLLVRREKPCYRGVHPSLLTTLALMVRMRSLMLGMEETGDIVRVPCPVSIIISRSRLSGCRRAVVSRALLSVAGVVTILRLREGVVKRGGCVG